MSYIIRCVATLDGWDEQLLVVLSDGVWTLPDSLPTRYVGRATHSNGQWTVKSLPHFKTTRCNAASFRHGVWVTRDDATPYGGFPTLFGLQYHHVVLSRIEALRHEGNVVRVAYHGTSGDAYKSIRTSYLYATRGQLGVGTYIGSFWKACRFAARDQAYSWRKCPTVIRVFWTCPRILTFPLAPCTCSTCSRASIDKQRVRRHDHVWLGEAGYLPVMQHADGTWVTRNEEWCVDPACIIRLGESVTLDITSVNGPNYDPLQRNIEFL